MKQDEKKKKKKIKKKDKKKKKNGIRDNLISILIKKCMDPLGDKLENKM